jgi:NitT/TauT family transport system substrate-binding protein
MHEIAPNIDRRDRSHRGTSGMFRGVVWRQRRPPGEDEHRRGRVSRDRLGRPVHRGATGPVQGAGPQRDDQAGSTSQAAINGQLAGTYDITSADYVTYVDNALLDKAPLRIVAESSVLQPDVLTLLVKAGSRVQSVQQLKHQVVSVNAPNDIGTLLVDSLLTDNGVPLNSVTFNNNVAFPNVGQELASGKVDAAFAPEPFVSLDGMQAGTEVLADLDQGGSAGFPIQGVAVTQSWARAHPNTLAAFERAYTQGQQIADTDRSAVESAIEQFLGLPKLAAALVSLPNFPTGVDPVRLQRLVDAMVRFGLLGKQYTNFKISTIIGNG